MPAEEEQALLADQQAAPPAAEGIPDPQEDADGKLKALTKEDALDAEDDSMGRSCTDIPCLLLFFVAVLAMMQLHHAAFTKGDPRRLFYGKDHEGNVCGVDDSVKDYPYVYYPFRGQEDYGESLLKVKGQGTVVSLQLTELVGVCTKACPDKGVEMHRAADLCPEKDSQYCSWYGQENSVWNVREKYCVFQDPDSFRDHGAECRNVKEEAMGAVTDLNIANLKQMQDLKQVVVGADGALVDVMDQAIEHMRVEGEVAKAEVTMAVDKSSESCTEAAVEPEWIAMMGDLIAVKELLFCVPLITLVFGFLYFILLRYCASVMIFAVIFSIIGGSGLGALLLFNKYELYMLENLTDDARYCWWGSMALGLISVLVGVVTACKCSTLRMTGAMMKAVATFLMQTPSVLLTVPVMLMTSALWFMYMISSGLFVVSMLTINPSESLAGELTRYDMPKPLMYKCVYHLLMMLWVNAIFTGLLIIGLAISVRYWYYAKPDENGHKITPFGIGFKSVYVAVRYHFGSAIFGGLLLAIVQVMRVLLKVVEQQVKKAEGNATVGLIIKAVDWFLWCMQKVVELINQVAYIVVGLKGHNFYQSAKRAVSLMLAHPADFFILHGVGILLEYVGILLSTMGSVIFFYQMILYQGLDEHVRSLFAPMAAIGILSGLTAKVFFSLFTAAADAFFFCFTFDKEVAAVTGKSDAQHCPPELKAFLDGVESKDEKSRGCCSC